MPLLPCRRAVSLAWLLLPAGGLLRAADPAAPPPSPEAGILPSALPLSRYEKMLARSPFSLPTAATPAPTPPPQPGWADALFVNAVMTVGERKIITIASRENNERTILATGDQANEQGIELLDVQWNDQVGQTRAVVRKNGVVATLLFDQAAVRAGAGASGPPGRMTSPPQGPNPNPPPFKPRGNAPMPPPPPVATPPPAQVTIPPGPPPGPPGGTGVALPPGSAPNDFPRIRARPIVAPPASAPVATPAPRAPRPGAPVDE